MKTSQDVAHEVPLNYRRVNKMTLHTRRHCASEEWLLRALAGTAYAAAHEPAELTHPERGRTTENLDKPTNNYENPGWHLGNHARQQNAR